MHYHFKYYKEDDGYWAECVELDGCRSEGDSFEDLKKNLEEALNLYLNEPANSKIIFNMPANNLTRKKGIVDIKVDPKIAFAYYLRIIRLKHHMTQKEVAEKMGYKSIWAYQKLETSKHANPELKTISKLKEIFPEFELSRPCIPI